jgi:hypothetical protein
MNDERTVLIADISIRYRVVQLPRQCPKCKTSLRANRKMRVQRYKAQHMPVIAIDGVLIGEEDAPSCMLDEDSDAVIENTKVFCRECEHVLAMSTWDERPWSEEPSTAGPTTWFKADTCLIPCGRFDARLCVLPDGHVGEHSPVVK